MAQRTAGPARRLRAFVPPVGDSPPAHAGARCERIRDRRDHRRPFSPTLSIGVALALLPADIPIGAALSVDVRGQPLAVEVVALPFVDASPR